MILKVYLFVCTDLGDTNTSFFKDSFHSRSSKMVRCPKFGKTAYD